MDRYDIVKYLEPSLGLHKYTSQGLKFCCPKQNCDPSQTKFNLEVCLSSNSSKYLLFHCWACHYKGHLKFLLTDYAKDNSWRNLKGLEFSKSNNLNEHAQKQEKALPLTIPYYLSDEVYSYLRIERNIHDIVLDEKKVLYCNSQEDSQFYNKIIFPFYEQRKFIGFSTQDLKTKKYTNNRSLNFVPYKEFINVNYPIIITEGIYDSFSVPNAIPMLGTKPSVELYKFGKDKKIILCLDRDVLLEEKKEISEKFKYYGTQIIVIFDLKEYKDLNEYRVKDQEGLKFEIKNLFELLL